LWGLVGETGSGGPYTGEMVSF